MLKKWWFWVAALSLPTLIYAVWHVLRPVSAKEGQVAPYAELQQKIRAGLVGTHSRCELGPATPAEQAEWAGLRAPRPHGRLASAELFKLSDAELYLEISERLQDKRYAVGLGGMTAPEQAVELINELEFEIANGGFEQYFANSTGNCALQTVAAARALDARLADLLGRALREFPNAAPDPDRATRNQQMESMPAAAEAWAKLDREMDADLSPLLLHYIRAHQQDFN